MKRLIVKYIAIFNVNADGISISFPDIQGCLSCAFTKKQSFKMAKDALKLMLHDTKIVDLPPQNFPIKHFSSKTFYIRTIKIKMIIKDECLYGKNIW